MPSFPVTCFCYIGATGVYLIDDFTATIWVIGSDNALCVVIFVEAHGMTPVLIKTDIALERTTFSIMACHRMRHCIVVCWV